MPTPLSPTAAPLAPGTLLHDRYRLVGLAGQGRFGQIYLARDQKRSDQLCVLKEFVPQETDRALLQTRWRQFHEAAACLYKLKHLQLPQFQVMIAQEQRFYWVQQYVAGKSYRVLLEERQAVGQALSEAEVRQMLEQVLPILHYLHDRGVAHGNLSPDSIIWQQESQLVLLIDFGLVYELVVQLQLVAGDTAIASPSDLPATAVSEPLSPGADLYALAVTAIVLLTGKQPVELYDPATQAWHWEPATIEQSPFQQMLRQMLHPNPQERFRSTKQVTQALRQSASTPASTLPPTQAAPHQAVKRHAQTRSISSGATLRPRWQSLRVLGLILLLAFLGGVAISIATAAWKMLASVQSEPKLPASPTLPSAPLETAPNAQSSPNAIVPVPTLPPSPAAEATPTPLELSPDLQAQQRQLDIDPLYLNRLTAEALPTQATQPAERDAIAKALLDKLQALSPDTRRKLGTYRRANYDDWLAQLGETGTNSPTLDALADQRFAEVFPEFKGKDLNPRTFGQIWYAIAEEQLSAAKTQKRPSPIEQSER